MTIQEVIGLIKKTFEANKRVKFCYKFQADKFLQIQLHNGENFNLSVVKLENRAHIIKRLKNRNFYEENE